MTQQSYINKKKQIQGATSFKFQTFSDCILQPQRIDIWEYPLNIYYAKANLLLSSEEALKAKRFYFERHQRRYTLAHSILRIILAHYAKLSPRTLQFSTESKGKPYLINHQKLQFNLSHSKDMALLAVGYEFPMGVDIEYYSERPYLGIGKILFSELEYHILKQSPPLLLPYLFFNIWTQKEAFIKACGLGLSYPTQTFNVPLSYEPQSIEDALHHMTWEIQSFMPQIGCSAALCYDCSIEEIRYFKLTHHHLTSFFQHHEYFAFK